MTTPQLRVTGCSGILTLTKQSKNPFAGTGRSSTPWSSCTAFATRRHRWPSSHLTSYFPDLVTRALRSSSQNFRAYGEKAKYARRTHLESRRAASGAYARIHLKACGRRCWFGCRTTPTQPRSSCFVVSKVSTRAGSPTVSFGRCNDASRTGARSWPESSCTPVSTAPSKMKSPPSALHQVPEHHWVAGPELGINALTSAAATPVALRAPSVAANRPELANGSGVARP